MYVPAPWMSHADSYLSVRVRGKGVMSLRIQDKEKLPVKGGGGEWSGTKWSAECRGKKKGCGGGREGGRNGERERELCERTRLKRTERSRAKQSYFT